MAQGIARGLAERHCAARIQQRGCDMFEVLQQWLAAGPVETTVLFHGSQTAASAKVKILSADAIGLVLQVRGWRDAYGPRR